MNISLYPQFNNLGITQSAPTKVRLLDSVASQASQNVIDSINDLKEGTIVGDNIDLVIKPRHHRLSARDQSCHWFNTDYMEELQVLGKSF